MPAYTVFRDYWKHGDVDRSSPIAGFDTLEAARAWMRDPANHWRRSVGDAHEEATDRVVATPPPPIRVWFARPSAEPTPHRVLPPLEEVFEDPEPLRQRVLPLFTVEMAALGLPTPGPYHVVYHEHSQDSLVFDRSSSGRLRLATPRGPVAVLGQDADATAAIVRARFPHPWLRLVSADLDVAPAPFIDDDLEAWLAWETRWSAAVAGWRDLNPGFEARSAIYFRGEAVFVQATGQYYGDRLVLDLDASDIGLVDWHFYCGVSKDGARVYSATQMT